MATRRLSGLTTSSSVPDNGGDHSGGGGSAGGYVDDVFSTYLYEGLSTGGTSIGQTIHNGIDLLGEGGLVWTKKRTTTTFGEHALIDTERGVLAELQSNSNSAETTALGRVEEFLSDGYVLGASLRYNEDQHDYVSWTFRKAPGFFDVVTYTGDSAVKREIPHNLGCDVGLLMVKRLTDLSAWEVWHNSFTSDQAIALNESNPILPGHWAGTVPTSTEFTVDSDSDVNLSGEEYVAYVFAHDDSDEGIIQCGEMLTNASGVGEIDLGWEPQWVLYKEADRAGPWRMMDSMRGMPNNGTSYTTPTTLMAHESSAEAAYDVAWATATGFYLHNGASSASYIYMAIRRPNKPAEEFEAEELFGLLNNIPANSATNNTFIETDNEFDMILSNPDYVGGNNTYVTSRLQGGTTLKANNSSAGSSSVQFQLDYQNGFVQDRTNGSDLLAYTLKRAPGFFDTVCYEGDGVAGREVPHGLGVAPEMMWVRGRDAANWAVYVSEVGATKSLWLDLPNEAQDSPDTWNSTSPSDTSFTLGTYVSVNTGGTSHTAYLWASVPGICDIGSYTGTGDAQWIDCGFGASAPRFVLIKSTSVEGNWYYWDSVRGLVSGNSPYLLLNTTDAQVTNTNWISPSDGKGKTGGFLLNSSSSSEVYKDGAEYIYMAIA